MLLRESFAVPTNQGFIETHACRLRLAVYKGLGFEFILDKDERVTKQLVRKHHTDFLILYNTLTACMSLSQGLSLAMFIACHLIERRARQSL